MYIHTFLIFSENIIQNCFQRNDHKFVPCGQTTVYIVKHQEPLVNSKSSQQGSHCRGAIKPMHNTMSHRDL